MLDDDGDDETKAAGGRRGSVSHRQSRISDNDMFALASSAEDQSAAAATNRDTPDDAAVDGVAAAEPLPISPIDVISPTHARYRPSSRRSSVLPPINMSTPLHHPDGAETTEHDVDDAAAAGVAREDDQVLG